MYKHTHTRWMKGNCHPHIKTPHFLSYKYPCLVTWHSILSLSFPPFIYIIWMLLEVWVEIFLTPKMYIFIISFDRFSLLVMLPVVMILFFLSTFFFYFFRMVFICMYICEMGIQRFDCAVVGMENCWNWKTYECFIYRSLFSTYTKRYSGDQCANTYINLYYLSKRWTILVHIPGITSYCFCEFFL